jgi:3(or 17)beta-hydroxysteroid dehydrogenase
MGRVEGKIAIVTGAAHGLGRAAAELLARDGASVVLTDIDEDGGYEAVEAITAAGGKAKFMVHDVSSEADWQRVIDETVSILGKLDILVNNAGVALQKNVEDTSLEEWRQLMSIDLDGVFLGTRCAIGAMKPAGGGSIINLSSIAGLVGESGLAAYSAAKGGVRNFTKSAALHCGNIGSRIRVNSIHPAMVRTELFNEYIDAQPDPAAATQDLELRHPIGFLGEPVDIAYAVLYLASDESRWVTGSELVIDGGYTAQ